MIGDTHGQSEAVFGLAHLLGVKLMPRMKNWNKVSMYWPERGIDLKNIGSWFSRYINWGLIKAHWQDMMQVILSIHNGKLLPSWLLQKLNSNNQKNQLYLAFREHIKRFGEYFIDFETVPPLLQPDIEFLAV